MMLAQEQLSTIPDSFWKNFCIALLVLLGAVGALVVIWAAIRQPSATKLRDEPPIKVEKSPKRYNHDAIDARFVGVERQVAENTSEIESIWNTFRAEDQSIREKTADRFDQISRSLGRIEGRLGTNPEEK